MTRLLVVAALAASACHRGEPSADDLVAAAPDQARRYFALAEGGDCGELEKLLPHPDRCKSVVEEMRETHTHLTSVDGAKLDGRDPHLVLVTVTAQAAKLTHHWIVHAKWTPDGWKVSM